MERRYRLFGTVGGHPPLCPACCVCSHPSDDSPPATAGVDALYPTGGFDGAAPEPLINSLNSFSAFPSFA